MSFITHRLPADFLVPMRIFSEAWAERAPHFQVDLSPETELVINSFNSTSNVLISGSVKSRTPSPGTDPVWGNSILPKFLQVLHLDAPNNYWVQRPRKCVAADSYVSKLRMRRTLIGPILLCMILQLHSCICYFLMQNLCIAESLLPSASHSWHEEQTPDSLYRGCPRQHYIGELTMFPEPL